MTTETTPTDAAGTDAAGTDTAGATPARTPLGSRYYRLLGATAISNIGDGMSGIAYPWLASAITRNPILIAVVAAAQRLPWLIFTLFAGVITDRVDRKKTMVAMDMLRAVFTLFVAFAVLARQGTLPAPDELQNVVGTQTGLYFLLLTATLLLGCAEVLRDNCGQTFMPAIVDAPNLEKANGRMWSAEGVANTFIGPPIGSLLLMVAFALPFFFDAASFFVAAALVFSIRGTYRAERPEHVVAAPWKDELAEGFRWLWHHPLFRAMAIILGLMNMASMISGATMVLFAQDVLGATPLTFTLMMFGFAIGGIIGGLAAPWMSKRFGAGFCLALTLGASAVMNLLVGVSSSWVVVGVIVAIGTLLGSTWNVITVSLRQSVIPSHLLGRVNSVYRFFAWGMMPIGAAIGGITVAVVATFTTQERALRSVWFLDAGIHFVLFVVGRRLLTTEKIERVRASAPELAGEIA